MPNPPSIEPWRWRIVWLLFLATLINYTDRLALVSTQRAVLNELVPVQPEPKELQFADPVIREAKRADLEAEREQKKNEAYGRINFAFGMSFGLFQILAGFLIDRFSLRALYLGSILIWSAAGVATGFAPTGAIIFLMSCRIVLGFGEAFNWPCAVATIRRIIPRESRSLANGIFHSGASIGAVATPFLTLLMVNPDGTGWRSLFILVGSIGGLWAILWVACTAGERGRFIDSSPEPERESAAETAQPFVAVLASRLFWITLLTGICVNVSWHVYYTWFPRYLEKTLGKSAQNEQWIMAGFFIAADLGSMFAGYTIRRLTRKGFHVENARKVVMAAIAAFCLLSIPAVLQWGGESVSLILFYMVAASAMGGFSIFFSLAQDIVGRHTAQILGVCGATSWVVIASINDYVGPMIGAAVKDKVILTYGTLFMVIGSGPVLAALAGLLWPVREAHH